MIAHIDIAGLRSRVASGFSTVLAGWPEIQRQRLERMAASTWPYSRRTSLPGIDSFNPLTSLYPALQAQGLLENSPQAVDTALLAHFCLLLHVYISDRGDDGQLHLNSRDTEAVMRLHDEALRLLRSLKPEGMSAPELRRTFEEVGDDRSEFDYGIAETRLADAADFSVRLGFLATACLLAYAGTPAEQLRLAAAAYRHTVIALQYADDMEDWKEDLQLGNRNLLLGFLEDRACSFPENASHELRELLVSQMLLRHNAHRIAAQRALDRLHAAKTIQQRLGCDALADQLDSMSSEIETRLPKLVRILENEVIVGYLLTPSLSRRS